MRGRRIPCVARALGLFAASFAATACGIGSVYAPTPEQLAAFEAAGPITPELDTTQLLSSIPEVGDYRVVPGDVLSILGGDVFLVNGNADSLLNRPVVVQTRVDPEGRVDLPLIGEQDVGGKSFWQIEKQLREALKEYVIEPPALVARVQEGDFATKKVHVIGAVERPGVVELPSDRMTLVGALTEAGGILRASNLQVGAKYVRVRTPGSAREDHLHLPVEGLNVPFADVGLSGGETIEVVRWDPDTFTVIGLVTNPGFYSYPVNRSLNLLEALSFAGGTDRFAAPPYATVFRKAPSGEVLAVTFDIATEDSLKAVTLIVKPGDVVSVQHTPGSWSRALFAQVFRAQFNFFVDPTSRR